MLRALSMLAFLAASVAVAEPMPEPGPANTDPKRLKVVPVVLRVKLDRDLGGESGAYWQKVTVLDVLKNESGQKLGKSLDVRTTVGKRFDLGRAKVPGVPAEECTIYLVPIGKAGLWSLLGGSAEQGVSHPAAKK